MAKTDKEIIEAIAQRMYNRRLRENHLEKGNFTMCYAVSVATGRCYVGYNMSSLTKTPEGTSTCAENRAAYVAHSHGEARGVLVFFARNRTNEYFNACSECQKWLSSSTPARGFLKNHRQEWLISTTHYNPTAGAYTPSPLSDSERETLYRQGDEIDEESRKVYEGIRYMH